jgi:hypothetical protein
MFYTLKSFIVTSILTIATVIIAIAIVVIEILIACINYVTGQDFPQGKITFKFKKNKL